MYTVEGGAALTPASTSDQPAEQWTSVHHTTLGWLHAPPGSHFQRAGETIQLVGATHRDGCAWYAASISNLARTPSDKASRGPLIQEPTDMPARGA